MIEPTPEEPIIIVRANELKAKAGGSLDASLATKADQSVGLLATEFKKWLEDVVQHMQDARAALGTAPLTKTASNALYIQVLEVKSLGATYGYALITRFAHSLGHLLINLEGERPAPPALVDAHIGAIKAALKGDMKSLEHPVGAVLAAELEQQVAKFYQTT